MSNLVTYIHLGLPKTATSTLQTHLFETHSQIHYLGKFFNRGFSPAALPALTSHIKKSARFEPGSIHLQPMNQQQVYAAENDKTVLLSKEGLAGGANRIKRRQAQVFAKHFGPCKIILFLREPESFVQSYYVQSLKGFHRAGPGRAAWMSTLGNPPHYFDINEWLDAAWNSRNTPRDFLAWADTADIYAEVFGKENISIYLFEDFVKTPKQTVSKLCAYMGIDAQEGCQRLDRKRENDRLTTHYTDRIKAIEKSTIQSFRFRRAGQKKRENMLAYDPDRGEKIRPELSGRWRQEIRAFSQQQNRRIATQWNIPLADCGYRV